MIGGETSGVYICAECVTVCQEALDDTRRSPADAHYQRERRLRHTIVSLQRDPQGQRVLPFIIALARQFSAQTECLQRAVTRVADRVTHIVDIICTQRTLGSTAPVHKDVDLRQTLIEAVKVLQPASLPPELAPAASGGAQPEVVQPLAQIERRALAHALAVSGNSVAAAARALKIDRSTLYRKLKKHGPAVGGRISLRDRGVTPGLLPAHPQLRGPGHSPRRRLRRRRQTPDRPGPVATAGRTHARRCW